VPTLGAAASADEIPADDSAVAVTRPAVPPRNSLRFIVSDLDILVVSCVVVEGEC